MIIKNMLLPLGSKARSGNKLTFAGVTIHNTANSNPGADADANARYLLNNANTIDNSWHYTVDDKEIIRSIPENEEAQHTGTRAGNHTTIGIEIAENSDGNLLAATNKAAELAADILRRHGEMRAVWKKNIFQHYDWSGKDCPRQIRRGNPYDWETFVNRVNMYLHGGKRPVISRVLRYIEDEPMRGEDIIQTQRRLALLGFNPGAADGIFGERTYRAVREFQKQKGLTADGIIGPSTWAALWE